MICALFSRFSFSRTLERKVLIVFTLSSSSLAIWETVIPPPDIAKHLEFTIGERGDQRGGLALNIGGQLDLHLVGNIPAAM